MGMRSVAALALLLIASAALAAPVAVEGVRMWPAPDNTRLVFDLSAPVEHSIFALRNPDRLVIDIKHASLDKLPPLDFDKSLIKRIRYAPRNGDDLRVVLDLKERVRPQSFVLKPNQEYGNRLVVDLYDQAQSPERARRAEPTPGTPRDIVVAIDAGHGGEDPGAIGRHGTREKDVVLAIARRLERLMEKEPGMHPVMIRDGDYYVGLRQRVIKAREQRADLFVSIHADSFRDARARGSSVFVLSTRGASSEAASWLADRENSADLIGGVSLDDKDELVAAVLLDLSQNASLEASHAVAEQVLGGLRRVNRLHKGRVERAGFRVLKAPDMPSILVETAFISNPSEERKLRNPHEQESLARAILSGVRRYFESNPPPGTLLAKRGKTHVIARGETLSGIAHRYRVNLESLRAVNGIRGDMLQVGQELRIPRSGS